MTEQPPLAPTLNPLAGRSTPWRDEVVATLRLGWPLIAAQLATMAITTTDVVMMGWLGPESLAAGSLAHAIQFPFLMLGMGIVLAGAPMIAQAVGRREFRSVRRTVRQGFWLAALISLVTIPLLLNGEWLLTMLGQKPRIADLGSDYLRFSAWHLLPAFLFIALRNLVSCHGGTRVVLVATTVGICVNAVSNYLLMFGHYGFPRLELAGAGISTTLVHIVMLLLLLGYVQTHRRMRRYAILVRLWRSDWPRLRAMFLLGLPIGLSMLAETGLFTAAATLMGWLGTDELAAHAVAIQLAALAFMVPLGLSQATTVRVGMAHGRGDLAARARASWASIMLSIVFMGVVALVFWRLPAPLVHLFLAADKAENAAPIALAVGYLGIAALFQLADGVQVTAQAALRGLSDTTVPAMVAIAGYFLIGIPTAYILGFWTPLAGIGLWLGLATGLFFSAILLVIRLVMLNADKAQGRPIGSD